MWILEYERPDVKAEVLHTEVPLDCCSPARTAAFSLLFSTKVHFNVFMKTREVAINGCSLIGVWVTIAQVEEWNHFSSSVLSRLPVHSHRICSIRKPPRLPEEESGVGD